MGDEEEARGQGRQLSRCQCRGSRSCGNLEQEQSSGKAKPRKSCQGWLGSSKYGVQGNPGPHPRRSRGTWGLLCMQWEGKGGFLKVGKCHDLISTSLGLFGGERPGGGEKKAREQFRSQNQQSFDVGLHQGGSKGDHEGMSSTSVSEMKWQQLIIDLVQVQQKEECQDDSRILAGSNGQSRKVDRGLNFRGKSRIPFWISFLSWRYHSIQEDVKEAAGYAEPSGSQRGLC